MPAEVDRVEQRLLIKLGQRRDEEALRLVEEVEGRVGVVHPWDSDGQRAMSIGVVVAGQRELPEVGGALDPAGRLARRLDGREEERDQEADDGDDDKHLDESEAGAVRAGSRGDAS